MKHTTFDPKFAHEETFEQKISEVETGCARSIHDGHVEDASIISIVEGMYQIFVLTEQNEKKISLEFVNPALKQMN